MDIAGRNIQRVNIIDDQVEARVAYGYQVENLDLEPIVEDGPIVDLEGYSTLVRQRSDAVICDHHLKVVGGGKYVGIQETVSCLNN